MTDRVGMRGKSAWRVMKAMYFGIFFLLFILTAPLEAKAEQADIFGPTQYAKPKGGSVTHTDSFSSPYPEGSYFLWVETGPNGLKKTADVSVSLNGSVVITSADLQSANPTIKPVVLESGSNTLTITLGGQAENWITVKVFCDDCKRIRITSPGEWTDPPPGGDDITPPCRPDRDTCESYVTVTGELVAGLEEEFSVLVNGVAALVKDDRFIANYVPIEETGSVITAELIEDDNTRSESTITYSRGAVYVALTADTDFGVVPLEVTFNAEVSDYFSLSSANLDCGQSGVEIQHGSLTEFTATFSQPGIYLCTLTATNTGGQTRQNSLGILVQTPEALDSLLQAKWAGMKEALYYDDIEGAVSFFAENSRASYHQQFTALSWSLPQIAADMGPITLLSVGKNSAIYDLRTIRNGTEYSFQLMFVRDGDGIWRIRNF